MQRCCLLCILQVSGFCMARADPESDSQDGKMLANRLKVLLGTSTFLQAFQHSGTLFRNSKRAWLSWLSCVDPCSVAVLP